jgi:hypothetical protein
MLKMTLNSSGLGDEEGKREREKNGQKSLRRQRPFKGCEHRGVVVVVYNFTYRLNMHIFMMLWRFPLVFELLKKKLN